MTDDTHGIIQENLNWRRGVSGTVTIAANITGSTAVVPAQLTPMLGLPVTVDMRMGSDGELHEIELIENGVPTSFLGDVEKQGIAKLMIHLLKRNPDFPDN